MATLNSIRYQTVPLLILVLVSAALLSWRTAASANAEEVEVKYYPGAGTYQSAGCMACHKWHGKGGTGYAGTPINFRTTELTKEQIMQVVACGRPGTGMPYFRKDAYKDYNCYDMTIEELCDDLMPPRAKQWLKGRQIRNVATFIVEFWQGRSDEVTKADCQLFFGDSKICDNVESMSSDGGGGH